MNSDISPLIVEKAPLILAEIQKAQSILLHCHPSPDPDSVGSVLATKFALQGMGKKVTVIKGDSDIPEAFMHFPGASEIVSQNFFEINPSDYDLFLILDSGSIEQVSRLAPFPVPFPIPTIVIDHHASNKGFGSLINLIESTYPATAQVLYDLFILWNVFMNHDIAANLFMGIYTDTGGFKYAGTTAKTLSIASALIAYLPDFTGLISRMENSNKPEDIAFRALALSSIETFLDGKLALAIVPLAKLVEKNIPVGHAHANAISSTMRSVGQWLVTGTLIEVAPGLIKLSFRSKDGEQFDVSKLTVALGGGGHKAAAGASMTMSLEDAKTLVVSKAKELYNL